MPLKSPLMGAETVGRKTPQRGRLCDITNSAPASLPKHRDENQLSKGSEALLQKELVALKKTLSEKEEIIEAQKVNMEKLWTNYCRKTKQNEDIIQHNVQLHKDLMQARDRLKILQHENAQMSAVHKICKSELELKLTKALEQANSLQTGVGISTIKKAPSDKQATVSSVLTKLAESRARRAVGTCEVSSDASFDSTNGSEDLEHPITCRSALRRRESLNYKEPSLKVKLRQPEGTSSQAKPCSNRRGNSIFGLHKVSEEQEPSISSAVMSGNLEAEMTENFSESVSQPKSTLLTANLVDEVKDQTQTIESSLLLLSEENPSAPIVEEVKDESMPMTDSAHFPEKTLTGRPCRQSVSCISSYKEVPINTKMRRPD